KPPLGEQREPAARPRAWSASCYPRIGWPHRPPPLHSPHCSPVPRGERCSGGAINVRRRFAMPEPNVGDQAPDFTLPSTIDNEWSLASARGNKGVIISFHRFDFTGDTGRG